MAIGQTYDDAGWWNPQEDMYDPYGYGGAEEAGGLAAFDTPAEEQTAGMSASPARWSHHLANDPYGGAAGQWAKQYYDNPNIDPGAAIQGQIGAFRKQYGDAAPEDDAGVINMIATGQAPQQQNQTPTQQWNTSTTPAATTPATSPVPAGPTSTTGTTASSDALLQFLIERAKQGTAVNRNDANIRAQIDPMTAQLERSSRNYLDTIAEGSRGTPFNMQGEQRMAAERTGQAAGLMEAQVIGREISARRDEIQQALTQWGSMLSDAQRLELQRELGYLEDRARSSDREAANARFEQGLGLEWWNLGNQDYYRRAGL